MEAPYYFICQNLYEQQDIAEIVGHTPITSSFDWLRGAKFTRPFPGDTLLLDPAYGSNLSHLFDTSVPLMSQALLSALADLGINNIDAYEIDLQRLDDGAKYDNYFAFNVLGCVDAVDLSSSPHRLRFGKPYFTGAIQIDPAKAQDVELFRLVYGPPFLVASARVAQGIQAGNFAGVKVMPTNAYQGA